MTHPFERWPRGRRRPALTALIVAATVPVAGAAVVRPLHEGEAGGKSIIDFEFAGSVERAEEVLATWRAEGVLDTAKAIQLFDLLYPVIYAAALAGACVAAAGAWQRSGRPRLAVAGIAMAWVAFAAAAFDYVENLGLAVSLWGEPASPWPQLAFGAATLKSSAIGLSLAYGLSGLLAWRLAGRPLSERGP